MAPEVLNRGVYNYKADIWSLGTILFEMLTGYNPFRDAHNKEQLKKKHRNISLSGFLRPDISYLSNECINFIEQCLTHNQHLRSDWSTLI